MKLNTLDHEMLRELLDQFAVEDVIALFFEQARHSEDLKAVKQSIEIIHARMQEDEE